jgi:hypothetical protein
VSCFSSALLLLVCLAPPVPSQQESAPSASVESRPESQPERREDWLLRHQSPDGRWSSDGFGARCAGGASSRCENAGAPGLDAGVTGLALLAFGSAGYDSQRPGPYRNCVKNGVAFLVSVQDARGRFGAPTSPHFAWSQAIATCAMAEQWSSSKQRELAAPTRRALEFLIDADIPEWPWNGSDPPSAERIYTTAWALLAVSTARWADVVQSQRLESVHTRALAYLENIVEHQAAESAPTTSRLDSRRPRDHLSASALDSAIAASLVARISKPFSDEDPGVERLRKMLRSRAPSWETSRDANDFQSWYLTTFARFHLAYLGDEGWPAWSETVRRLVLDRQVKQGCAEGSWEPADAFGAEGGRVYSTAIMDLILIQSWRYPKWFR